MAAARRLLVALLNAKNGPLIAAAAVSILGFFPLMGGPGFLAIPVLDRTANLLFGRPAGHPTDYGDAGWPIALTYSIAIPWLVFALHAALKAAPLKLEPWQRGAGSLALAFVVAAAAHAFFCYPIGYGRADARIKYARSPEGRRERLRQALLRFVANDAETFYSNLRNQEDPSDVSTDFLAERDKAQAEPGIYHLTPAQAALLKELEAELRKIQSTPELLTEASIRTSPDWKKTRSLATKILSSPR